MRVSDRFLLKIARDGMSQKILSGTFRNPDGAAVPGVTLMFSLAYTTSESFLQRQASVLTDSEGKYSISLYDGVYQVRCKDEGLNSALLLGNIAILEDSQDGTLNDFLLAGTAPQTNAMLTAIQKAYQQILGIHNKPATTVGSFADIPEGALGWYLVEKDETKGLVPVAYLFTDTARYWFAMVEDS